MILKYFLLIFPGIYAGTQCQDSSVYTCKDCLMRAKNCAWCGDDLKLEDIKGYVQRIKCGTESDLKNHGCKVIIAKPTVEDERVEEETSETVLISPQKLEASLRYGDPFKFELTFKSPSHYPIDMYYLMDLSQSMEDDLQNLRVLAANLTDAMIKQTGNNPDNIRIGLGSFVDKTVMPFVSTVPEKLNNPCEKNKPCDPPYTYINSMALDSNTAKFHEIIKKINSSSNLDAPEAGLDAMMQAIVCDKVVGWDKTRHKVLVYASDAPFHVAGDGKLGGILEPNDMKCHTEGEKGKESYVDANKYDYPSIGQIIDVINREQILVIFAVTTDQLATYQQLKNLLPLAEVGELTKDSNNVIELITKQYQKLRQKVELINNLNIPGVSLKVRANCHTGPDGTGFVEGSVCKEIKQHETVKFEVELEWTGDTACPPSTDIRFSIFGVEAQTDMKINFICNCDCKTKPPPNFLVPEKYLGKNNSIEDIKFSCNDGSYTTCGHCNCPANMIGNMCECNIEDSSEKALNKQCINPDSPDKPCSGKSAGECICGRCQCHDYGSRKITGQYCECDTDVCLKSLDNNRPCGGEERGTCNCKTARCDCNPGWTGDACTCPTSTKPCINENEDSISSDPCSGKGDCNCGKCECWDFGEHGSYQGEYCQKFNSQCENYMDCILCIANAAEDPELKLGEKCMQSCLTKTEDSEYSFVEGIIYDSSSTPPSAKIDRAMLPSIIKKKADLPPDFSSKGGWNGKYCIQQDEDICQFHFKFQDKSDSRSKLRTISVIIQEERSCPTPPNPLVVAGGILGGVVLLGLIILALIKMIIWWISRREVKEWEKERGKNTITSGHNPLYEAPETRHTTTAVKYRPGYKSSAAH